MKLGSALVSEPILRALLHMFTKKKSLFQNLLHFCIRSRKIYVYIKYMYIFFGILNQH